MPEEKERPRPHGDPLEPAIDRNPEENRAQSQSDATPEEIPRRGDPGDRDLRETSDRARGRGSTANGIPEFDEDAGDLRRRQYDDGAGVVSGID
jgi:hypothetical protein